MNKFTSSSLCVFSASLACVLVDGSKVEMKNHFDTEYEIGQQNLKRWGMDIYHPVFWIPSALVFAFVVLAIVFPELSKSWFDTSKNWSISNFDWLFMYSGNFLCWSA